MTAVFPVDQHRFGPKLRRWPEAEERAEKMAMKLRPFEVWRSRDFLAQLYEERSGFVRVSVNRTHQPDGQDWAEGISWDDLQRVKREIGRADAWAVEVYPADAEVVNEANMRHLWLLGEAPPFAWQTTTNAKRSSP